MKKSANVVYERRVNYDLRKHVPVVRLVYPMRRKTLTLRIRKREEKWGPLPVKGIDGQRLRTPHRWPQPPLNEVFIVWTKVKEQFPLLLP